MTTCRHRHHHRRSRRRCHRRQWRAAGILLVLPLWLAVRAGRAIHARWGTTGVLIYAAAWWTAVILHHTLNAHP